MNDEVERDARPAAPAASEHASTVNAVTATSGSRRVRAAMPAADATNQHQHWSRRQVPPVELVRPGIWSLPVVIPNSSLNYVIAYAIETSDGLVLIDTGWDSEESWQHFTAALRETGHELADVSDVLLTHAHLDHNGLTRRVVEHSGAQVHLHPIEAETLQQVVAQQQGQRTVLSWLTDHGAPESEIKRQANHTPDTKFIAAYQRMWPGDRRLLDGQRPITALPELRTFWTPGHTRGHVCFALEDRGLLFSGDHLLPRITPSVEWMPGGAGDPLADYLRSLRLISQLDVEEALPSHEYRFVGIRDRVESLLSHHAERFQEIELAADGGATTWQITSAISWSRNWDELTGLVRKMALGETLAHLTHLETTHRVRRVAERPVRWKSVS